MWVARFKVWHKGSGVLEGTRGIDAYASGYVLNAFVKDGATYVNRVLIPFGREREKLREALFADKRVEVTNIDGQQIFFIVKAQKSFHSVFFDKTIFFTKPIALKDGFEYWTVASWAKENLLALYERVKALEKKGKARITLLEIKEQPLNLFLPNVLSRLTEKQRGVIAAAVREGYYEYPRRTSLEQLARRLRIPRTTLQSHLRKAERAVIPAAVSETIME